MPKPPQLTLVTNTMCPYAQKAWISLLESNKPFELKEIDLYGSAKPKWFLDLNPAGLVPVLIKEDGEALNESDKIVTFLNPSGDDKDFASYLNTDFLPSTKKAILSSSLPTIAANLLSLQSRLSPNAYFSGEDFGNSDVRVLPFLQRIDEEFGIPEEVRGRGTPCRHLHLIRTPLSTNLSTPSLTPPSLLGRSAGN